MCNCSKVAIATLLFLYLPNIMKRFLFFFIFFYQHLFAQEQVVKSVLLDSVTIFGVQDDFDVDEFIYYVKTDTTFYIGFKNLRYFSHKYKSELNLFNKKSEKIGVLKKWGTHHSDNKNAWVVNDSIYDEGKIFKRNGKYKFYTPDAFDEVFFPKDTIEVSLNISRKKNKKQSQNMRDAKMIGFSIGTDNTEQKKGGVSKKLAIFDVNMRQYYDYTIGLTNYKERDCYTFTVEVKKDLNKKDLGQALIRKIVSYFDKENFNVIYREYKFFYKHFLVDLDIDVVINMEYVNGIHVPIDIYYKGFWDFPFFKPERASFELKLYDYQIN